jgi:choline dehydrogenase-like flavoprotein
MEATLEAEVAIAGAGPAGITLALELAKAGHHVLLIESGGDSYSADAQALGETVGGDPAHVPMSFATRRQIGGASNLWGGRCVPFDPVDFQRRGLVGDIRWPLSYDALARHFSRACQWCMCGEPTFDAAQIATLAGNTLIPQWPGGDMHSTSLERWSCPTNFGRVYRANLRDSALVTVVTNLTCTEIVCAPDKRKVAHLAAQTLAGNRVRVRAKRYVLACGGVESTRLLFASNRRHPGGIGNHSGHLGRWYMAHLGASVARIHLNTPADETLYGFERDADGIYVRRRFTFSPDYLVEHDLPNVAMWLDNPPISDPSHRSEILSFLYLALASPLGRHFIAEGIRQRKIATNDEVSNWRHLRNVLQRLPQATLFALRFGYERYVRAGHKVPGVFLANAANVYPLYYHGEHLPHHASHIAPTSELDALGLPRVRTRLRFEDDDIRDALRAHEHFDRYLRRNGIGRLEFIHADPHAAFREQLLDGYHQAGTTRMSARPEDGVLDAQLAVHGLRDLFVASSSAFPTSGQANSTFTIVVIALRLAEHLHRTLRPTIAVRPARSRLAAARNGAPTVGTNAHAGMRPAAGVNLETM